MASCNTFQVYIQAYLFTQNLTAIDREKHKSKVEMIPANASASCLPTTSEKSTRHQYGRGTSLSAADQAGVSSSSLGLIPFLNADRCEEKKICTMIAEMTPWNSIVFA